MYHSKICEHEFLVKATALYAADHMQLLLAMTALGECVENLQCFCSST